jgi:hypothetical protein
MLTRIRIPRWRASIGAALLIAAAPASGQVAFTDMTTATGLQFDGDYGPILSQDVDLPDPVDAMMVLMQRNMGNGAAVADYDNDGDLDVFLLAQLGKPSVLYRNDVGVFTDVTGPARLTNVGQSRVACFVDLDNNGWQDLILCNDVRAGGTEPPTKIYRNMGNGKFRPIATQWGFDPTGYITGGLGLVDENQDGLIDIYVTYWVRVPAAAYPSLEGRNRLYRNLGGLKFQEVTRKVGLGYQNTNSFTPMFADFDNDGDSDLYQPIDGFSDAYYRRDAGMYVDDTQQVDATHVGSDMGAALCDFDDDGDMDLFVSNATAEGGGGNTLLVNQVVPTGQLLFVDEAAQRGVFDAGWGWGTEWIDADNDGDRDLFVVNGFDEFVKTKYMPPDYSGLTDHPAHMFLNDGTGNFTNSVASGCEIIGDARCTIAFDYDRDGDQDLLITHTDASTVLLQNDSPTTAHSIDIRLVGTGPTVSRDAIGARIKLIVGSKTYCHEVIGGGSYLAGRPFEAHFGLGAATVVDQIIVTWPGSSTSTVLNNVPADQYLVITQ